MVIVLCALAPVSCSREPADENGHLGTVVVVAPGFSAEEFASLSDSLARSGVSAAFLDDASLLSQEIDSSLSGEQMALVAFGHRSTPVWDSLPEVSDRLRSAVFVSVPSGQNVEVQLLHGLPILDLHSRQDSVTVSAHQRVHDALSIAGLPHEMVVYDGVQGDFFAASGRAFDSAAWADAAARIVEWVVVSLRSDELREVRRS
ncbi:dienelactone hydrolase family protein [Rathayibacter sp. VKM Ac-2857]|uniref:dienelactone hydrolase family protein n=1 Tax=Rathayibacter sp. VKM Ac-2857 TaxID=2739020 RepID=UPI0015671E14|nr:dienelactone hydrolase family protein [Rathayibacter sp. VKM Ac-2857]